MKRIKQFVITLIVLSMLIPGTVYAGSFGNYIIEDISYPAEKCIGWSSLYTNRLTSAILFYNSLDEKFYLLLYKPYETRSGDITVPYIIVDNASSRFEIHRNNCYFNIYSYQPDVDETWVQTSTLTDSGYDYKYYINISRAKPTKFLSVSENISVTIDDENSTVCTVTNKSSLMDTGNYIYADFYDAATGYFLKNDYHYSSGTGSGTGDGSTTNVIVNIDTSGIESILNDISAKISAFKSLFSTHSDNMNSGFTRIGTKIDSLSSTMVTQFTNLKTALTTNFNELKSSITSNFTALTAHLDEKYEELYNVIIYGNKDGEAAIKEQEDRIEEMSSNLDGIVGRLSDVDSSLSVTAGGISSYVSTFSEFYSNTVALNIGLSAIMEFGLFMILMRKIIGR